MRTLHLLFIVAALATACASTRHTSSVTDDATTATGNTNERDGTSFQQAIVVNSVREEYEWVRERYPEAQMRQQLLSKHGSRYYDILTFTMPDGTDKNFYFDIHKFYGKF